MSKEPNICPFGSIPGSCLGHHIFKYWLQTPDIVCGVPRGGWGIQTPHPHHPKFRRPSKIVLNSTRLRKLLKIVEFRAPTPQDVRKKGTKILKLPPVRNCFTLAMTNKLVVIINSLKVPKIKKIFLYETKFLVPNYTCLQNPWLGGLPPPDPRSLCPQLNLLNPPPRTKFLCTPLDVVTDFSCLSSVSAVKFRYNTSITSRSIT